MTDQERIEALETKVQALEAIVDGLLLEREVEPVSVFEAGHRQFHDDVRNGRVLGG